MISRRSLFSLIPVVALAACVGPTTPNAPDPLTKIKTLAAVTVAEMPLIVQDLANTGGLKGQQLVDAQKAVTAAQQILPQVETLQTGVSSQTQITAVLTALLNSLQIVMSFVPQTAPYAPAVAALTAIVQAYLIGIPPSPNIPMTPATAQILRY